jgi:hypothetical protein
MERHLVSLLILNLLFLATQSFRELRVFLCSAANLDSLEITFLYDFIANLTAIYYIYDKRKNSEYIYCTLNINTKIIASVARLYSSCSFRSIASPVIKVSAVLI